MQAPKRPSLLPIPEPQTTVNSSVVGLILPGYAAAHSQWCSWCAGLSVEDVKYSGPEMTIRNGGGPRPGPDRPGPCWYPRA